MGKERSERRSPTAARRRKEMQVRMQVTIIHRGSSRERSLTTKFIFFAVLVPFTFTFTAGCL